MKGHTDRVFGLVELLDGCLASASFDKTIKIWSLKSKNFDLIKTLTDNVSHIFSLAVLSNDLLASGLHTNSSTKLSINIWNTTNASITCSLRGHSSYIFALSHLKGDYFASGSFDTKVIIWNHKTCSLLHILSDHSSYVHSIVKYNIFNKQYLASGSRDMTIKLWRWNSTNFKLTQTLFANGKEVYSLNFMTHYGLVAGYNDSTIGLWDLTECNESDCKFVTLQQTVTNQDSPIYSMELFSDCYLATSSVDNVIKIWNLTSKTQVMNFTGHTESVFSMLKLKNRNLLASASLDKTIRIWDISKLLIYI